MNQSINQIRAAKRNSVYGYLTGVHYYLNCASNEDYIYPAEMEVLQRIAKEADNLLNTWKRKLPILENKKEK